MKVKSLSLLAGLTGPLIMAGPTSAEFVGISVASKPNPFGVFTVNVYAVFDRPGEDFMEGVGGTPDSPLRIEVTDGSFYEHVFGSDAAPPIVLVLAFPSLAYDTFVTIGVKVLDESGAAGQPVNNTVILPGAPLFAGEAVIQSTAWGWAVVQGEPQGDPFNPGPSFPGNGSILIGQFSTEAGSAILGKMLLQYTSNGVKEQQYVSFCLDSSGQECSACPWDCGAPPDGEVSIEDFIAVIGTWGQVGVACDLDGDGVGIEDFLKILGFWGPCLPQPTGACCLPNDSCELRTLESCKASGGSWKLAQTACDDYGGQSDICLNPCPWDCADSNGVIDILDMLAVLQQWGDVGTSCDYFGAPGVSVNEFMGVLANWGLCP